MKIIITDGYALNPGDLSWDEIAALGELTVYERTPSELLVERCKQAEIVLPNKTPVTRTQIEQLPLLRLISVMATGYNVIDISAASEKNIVVCNIPTYGTASVAQHTIALLLELTNHVGLHSDSVAAGDWQRSKDWAYAKTPLVELSGKIFGVVGFGNIGQQAARIANAMGMKIFYYSRREKNTGLGTYCGLETLFASSDVISLHCPLKPENMKFVNKKMLNLMKPSAFLINTSRGQLIDESDLADALNNHVIAGAALDVLSSEPPSGDNPLLYAKNCIVTPHNAWMSREARVRIMDTTRDNIVSFLKSQPIHIVNK